MGIHYNAAQALTNLSSINTAQGKYQESLDYLQRAAGLAGEMGLQPQGIYIQLGLASTYHGLHDLDKADGAAQEAILHAGELGFDQLAVMGYLRLGTSAFIKKDISSIYANVLQALEIQARAQGVHEYVGAGILVASALDLNGKVQEATAMLGKSLALAEEIEHSPDLHARQSLDELIEKLKASNTNYDEHVEKGEAWTMDQFVRNMT